MVITANPPKFDKRQPSKGAYDAIVYIEGSEVVAEDANGRKISSGTAGTDDATVIQAAVTNLTTGRTNVEILKLSGSFVVASTVQLTGYTKLDLSSAKISGPALGSDPIFSATGTVSGAKVLSANATKTDTSISVASGDEAGYVCGNLIRIRSSHDTTVGTGSKDGEIQRVLSTADGVINLYDSLLDSYATADTATVEKVDTINKIIIEGGELVGGGVGTNIAARLTFCENLVIRGVTFTNFTERSVHLVSVLNGNVYNCNIHGSNNAGTGYGISLANCCQFIKIRDNNFYDNRHGITAGGIINDYGFNRYVDVIGNTGYGCTSAMIDCHSNGQHWLIESNQVFAGRSGISEGIVTYQGRECIIRGNQADNIRGVMIYATPVIAGTIDYLVLSDNTCKSVFGLTGTFIAVMIKQATTINNLMISDNICASSLGYGIRVDINNAAGAISKCSVKNNHVTNNSSSYEACNMRLQSGTSFDSIDIIGNNFTQLANNECVYLVGSLTNVNCHDNNIVGTGGTNYGIRANSATGRCYRNYISGVSVPLAVVGFTEIRENIGYLTESSGASTGTGSEQTIAHGLAAIPTGCKAWITYLVGARYITEMIPFDATNVYPTVDNGVAYEWRIE